MDGCPGLGWPGRSDCGKLTVFCGCRSETYDRCLPVLSAMATSITRWEIPVAASGQTRNQIVGSINILALSED